MTCAVVLWVLLGTPAGYVSARMYKSKYMHLFNVTHANSELLGCVTVRTTKRTTLTRWVEAGKRGQFIMI